LLLSKFENSYDFSSHWLRDAQLAGIGETFWGLTPSSNASLIQGTIALLHEQGQVE
jgi:hypothetical protein